MAITTKIEQYGWSGPRGVTSFFQEKANSRPRYLRLGVSQPFNTRIELEWQATPNSLKTTNNMANSNELLWKIPSGQSLPTNLRIIMNETEGESDFAVFTIEGGSSSSDDVLLYREIELTFNAD